jgi:predicted nucleic acid-binding protein
MLNTILIDAGPLIALFDKDDSYHERIIEFIKNRNFKFITTTAVITEVSYMLNFNVEVQILFFEWILNEGVLIQEMQQSDISRIIELTKKYRDRPMDFADATLVVAAEKTGIRQIISIDSDFDIYRLPKKVRIENIFKD